MKTKLYIYGVVRADETKVLGPLGLSTNGSPEEIHLHSKDGIGIVYTGKECDDDDELPASRKNLVNHQRVIELLMSTYTVLPFSFGTLIDDVTALEQLIVERKAEFEATLDKIDGKIELGLKVLWENMDQIFDALVQEDEAINQKRQYLIANGMQDQDSKIELGKMVEAALDKKKEFMLNKVLDKLKPQAIEYKVQKNITDAMFANVAFFVHRSDEKQFDEYVNELSDELGDNITFKYVGPIAPVNFI